MSKYIEQHSPSIQSRTQRVLHQSGRIFQPHACQETRRGSFNASFFQIVTLINSNLILPVALNGGAHCANRCFYDACSSVSSLEESLGQSLGPRVQGDDVVDFAKVHYRGTNKVLAPFCGSSDQWNPNYPLVNQLIN